MVGGLTQEQWREEFAAKNARRRVEKRMLGGRYREVRAARRALRPVPGAFGDASGEAMRRLT